MYIFIHKRDFLYNLNVKYEIRNMIHYGVYPLITLKNINTKRKEYLNFNINPYHYKMVGFFYYNVIFINIIV